MENVNVIQTSKDDETNNFLAARVEIPFDRVTELIHLQNYADSLRIVRASVGKNIQDSLPQQQSEGEESSEENESSEQSEQTNNEQNNNESNQEKSQEETNQNDSSEE
ncbi:hypothetical protein [Piscibacillus salipiscarius]|nr:hypothetical protein [Piscibacillus salipiscarius]